MLEKPITADTIIKERNEFKKKQLDAYEAAYEVDFKSACGRIIKLINENLSAAKTNEKFEVKLLLKCVGDVDVKYQDANLKKVYLKKKPMDFIKKMYPGFKITIIDENQNQIKFKMTLE